MCWSVAATAIAEWCRRRQFRLRHNQTTLQPPATDDDEEDDDDDVKHLTATDSILVHYSCVMADNASTPAASAAPVSPQYTLLRVKRKRDDNPVASLILTGETESQPSSSKRSTVNDIRTLLGRTRLADDEKTTQEQSQAREAGTQAGRRAQLRRVFKLVGTVPSASSSPDDALLSRIAAMQTARQTKAVHPSIAPGSSVSDQRDRQMEAQQQRAAAARTEKLKEARAATSSATSSSSTSTSASASPTASAPFAFLDVSITKHFPAATVPHPLTQQIVSTAAFQSVTERPVVAETAEQQHRDSVFSRAMTIVRAMPETDKMAAYASLLDDYWQATTGSTDSQQPSFTQQLQQRSTQPAPAAEQPKPRVLAGTPINLSALAPPHSQHFRATAPTSQTATHPRSGGRVAVRV